MQINISIAIDFIKQHCYYYYISIKQVNKVKDLVFINSKKEAVCSHVAISTGMKVTQDSSLKLIKQYKSDLEDFGKVRFQNVPLESGQKQKQFMLNRDQAMFLITLMRNNIQTVAFKKALVKQFSNMEAWIKDRLQSSIEYKVMSATLHDAREIQGKTTGKFNYINEANLVNWAMTGEFKKLDRESLNASEIQLLNDLQTRNAVLIGAGMTRENRKAALSLYAELKEAA